MGTVPVLDITTTIPADRPTVAIDGAPYPLKHPSEFSILDFHRLARQGARLDSLMLARDLTKPEEDELCALLDTLARSVLVAPDEVHCALKDTARAQIFTAWVTVYPEPRPPGLKAQQAMVAAAAEGAS